MIRSSPGLLLCAALSGSFATPAPSAAPTPRAARADGASEAEAAEELALAVAHAARGRYQRAREGFERVARRWPDTASGREARARLADNGLFAWSELVTSGPPSRRIDVVVMGDGYTFEQQDAFDDLAADLPRELERNPVFGEYFDWFNFVRANLVSAEAGVDGYGREAATALGGRAIDYTDDANVTVDRALVHAVLRRIPASEGLAIAVVKRGRSGTAAAGIATIGGTHLETLLHEWGHAFADLGDEYATDHGFRQRLASERANVSLTDDPERVPWAHWIAAGAPGIGTYEGAAGLVRDAWRPKASGCVMNDGRLFFCAPCREAIVLAIHERVDPIETLALRGGDELEAHGPPELGQRGEPLVLEARLLQPRSHGLEASWYVIPEARAPRVSEPGYPRSKRGPLAPLDPRDERPAQHTRRTRDGTSTFRLDPRALEPGRYLVLLRVRDTTRMAGEKLPWVLRDEHELLASERAVWVVVP